MSTNKLSGDNIKKYRAFLIYLGIVVGISCVFSACEGVVEEDEKDPSLYLHALVSGTQVSLICDATTDVTNLPGSTISRSIISGPFSKFDTCESEQNRIIEHVLDEFEDVSAETSISKMCLTENLSVLCNVTCSSSKAIESFNSSLHCLNQRFTTVNKVLALASAAGNYNSGRSNPNR